MGKQRKCYHLNQAGAVREHEGTAQSGVGGTVERTQIPNMKVDSTSGKHKAVFDGKTISIIDNATKKVVTTINVSQTIPPKGGVDSEVTAMYFIGDRLFLRDSHAGPHEDIVLYSIDGKLHGTVWNEVYGGSVTIIDAHRIAFGYADMSSFAVYDTRDHKLTEMKRALPETPACTKKIREELNVDVEHMSDCKGSKDPHKQQCCLQLRPVFQYQQASIVPMGNTTIALVPAGKSFAMVGLYDTAKRAVTKHVNLACATVHK